MINTVILDIGGTLIGAPDFIKELEKLFSGRDVYEKLKTTLINEYMAIRNGEKDFSTIEKIIEKSLSKISAELNYSDVSKYAKDIYYDTFVTQSYLFDDTILLLDYLKRKKIKILIASDADAELLYDEFAMHNLNKYFDKMFISSKLKSYKPHDRFISALKCEIIEPLEKIMFVGDTEADIITGQKLGIKTVLKGEITENMSMPDYTINNLRELINLLDHID